MLVACALGGVIGWDRESLHKPAGLRTHMLVAGAAALFVILGEGLITQYGTDAPGVRFDLVGVLSAVVTGVSFLGAGTIFSSGSQRARGLTTAASLLATAGIGVACGLMHYVLAAGAALSFLFILNVLGRVKTSAFTDDSAHTEPNTDQERDGR